MADIDPYFSEGPGNKLVQTGFIIFFGVLLLASTCALLYGIYAACPVCEPPDGAASAAPTTTADTPQPAPSQSPGVTELRHTCGGIEVDRRNAKFRPGHGGQPGATRRCWAEQCERGSLRQASLATLVGSPNPTSLTVKTASPR